ncbi:hypothetical protein B566_EDAN016817, partial [Ephemera danica]
MELLPSLGVPSLNSIALVSLLLLFLLLPKIRRRLRVVKLINKLPGPGALPWIGNAIEINVGHDGRKWHTRRKILTPTFHFRILEDFIDVFREHSNLLVQCVARELNNTGFDLFPYITLCALDIICETAMGRQIHAQEHQDSDYVKAIYEIGDIIQTRQAVLWMGWDWVFHRSKLYEPHQRCIRILHDASYKA